jgi:hypothetical protein
VWVKSRKTAKYFYFLTANLAPQTEHFPSAVILGCSLTSPPHNPHFKLLSPPSTVEIPKRCLLANYSIHQTII